MPGVKKMDQKNKEVRIGNVTLGTGRMPAICVPILAYGVSEVMNQAKAILDSPADLVEFRADYMDDTSFLNAHTMKTAMAAVRNILPQRPILYTLRTKEEGSDIAMSDRDYLNVCISAIDTGLADAIDIEFSHEQETIRQLVDYAHEHDVKVVMSSHNFQSTPDREEMAEKMKAMQEAGADIAKIAVMPQSDEDVTNVMLVSEEMKRTLSVPHILISMGELGATSRVTGQQSGSVLTFGTVGTGSAPGQINADDLDRAMRILRNAGRPVPKKRSTDLPNIILGGFMGVGKSSTAAKIALYSDLKVLEMDEMIEEREGMSIPEIFEKHGEAYFRQVEADVCREISEMSGVVVSTGGGTLLRQSNVDELKKNGVIYVMEASPDVVCERLSHSDTERPLLKEHMNRGYISWLMKQRQDAYEQAADDILDVSRMTPGAAAVKILSLTGKIPG